LKNDTVQVFKTKGGRTVYGGGGISPDVFVPYDTAGFTIDVSALFINQDFGKFIYSYYKKNKKTLDQFGSAAAFAKGFKGEEDAMRELKAYINANKIDMPTMPAQDEAELKKRIKTWLARQIWRMDGYYEVANEYDRTVIKGMEALK
ncbi:MAG: S41 family peptidase, partial [Flavitalea sp.]